MGGSQSSVQQTRPTREGAACTEQGDLHRTAHMILFLTTQCVVLTKHTMQFRCSLIVGLFCSMQFGWSPLHFAVYYGHLNIVNQLVNVCRLPPEQKTKVHTGGCLHVRTGGQGLFACQVQVALQHKQLTVALSEIVVCKTDPYILCYLHNSSKWLPTVWK